MPLKDIALRAAKPREKPYRLSDEKGLYLFVTPAGSESWRFEYCFGGKEKLLSIGVYPEISLADAREKRDEARKLLINKIDSAMAKQITKKATQLAAENSFEAIARE